MCIIFWDNPHRCYLFAPLHPPSVSLSFIRQFTTVTKIVFLVHRLGYLIPVRVNAYPDNNVWKTVWEPIQVKTTCFLVFTNAETGWRVTGEP